MDNTNLSAQEMKRLEELYSYGILDTAADAEFDELVAFASQLSGCPMAAISFIDKDRQWFKAKHGDDKKETPRDISFCAHAILNDEPLIIEDATKDPRFSSNPDVTSGLHIRSYAAVPIYSRNKQRLGAVCIMDQKPGKISKKSIIALKLISKEVSHLLELNLRSRLLEEYSEETLHRSVNSYQLLFENGVLPSWIYEFETLRFLHVNEAALKKYGYTREEFLAMTVYDIRADKAKTKIHQLLQGVNGKTQTETFHSAHCTKDGKMLNVEVTISDIVYMGRAARIATIQDISEKERLKRLEDEKQKMDQQIHLAKKQERDFIGKELHDNINQILSSTKLYLEMALSNPAMTEDMIRLSKKNVIEAMKEIRTLSHSLVVKKQNSFDLKDAIDKLIVTHSLANSSKMHFSSKGNLELLPEDIRLTLFRIIQEQFNNIVKHAGATEICIGIEAYDKVLVQIKDNGRGFDPRTVTDGIGLNNMKQRVEFYNGIFSIASAPGKGCFVELEIPLMLHEMSQMSHS